MAVGLQRAWSIATELSEKGDLLNRLIGRVVAAKEPDSGESLSPAQVQNIRNRATATAQEMQTLLNELLAP